MVSLLTFDLCQEYDNFREECREVEERWEKLRGKLSRIMQNECAGVRLDTSALHWFKHMGYHVHGLISRYTYFQNCEEICA